MWRETDPQKRSKLSKSPSECEPRNTWKPGLQTAPDSPRYKAPGRTPWGHCPEISPRRKTLEASGVLGNGTHYLLAWEGSLPSVPWRPSPSVWPNCLQLVCCQPGFPSDPVWRWKQPSWAAGPARQQLKVLAEWPEETCLTREQVWAQQGPGLGSVAPCGLMPASPLTWHRNGF